MRKTTTSIKPESNISAIARLFERLAGTESWMNEVHEFIAEIDGYNGDSEAIKKASKGYFDRTKSKKVHNITFETKLSSGVMVWNFMVRETAGMDPFIESAAQLTPRFDGTDKYEVAEELTHEDTLPRMRAFLEELKGWAENSEVSGRVVTTEF